MHEAGRSRRLRSLVCGLITAAGFCFILANGKGVTVLRSRTPTARSTAQGWQALASSSGGEGSRDEPDVIRFENDERVGGGDLLVPVGMVDYENLGQGSIVDQRYPRKLPGQDELEADIGSLFGFSPSMQQAKPPKDTTGGKDFDEVTKDDAEQGEDDDSEDAMGNGEESEKQEMPGKLESMGVNVDHYPQNPRVPPPSAAQKEDGEAIVVDANAADVTPSWPYLKGNHKLEKMGVNVNHLMHEGHKATRRRPNDSEVDEAASRGQTGGERAGLKYANEEEDAKGEEGGKEVQTSQVAPNKCRAMKRNPCRASTAGCDYSSVCGCVPKGCACDDTECIAGAQ